ncbi:hypothetical protein PV728_02495 [Streptomyces europaeiscabiei]|uniref:hypothetical protein n=1 Tax=Streptomyces europaeiscabiei TaxID=146819 RepID=UPI0029BC8393|nr:hypothetical protein [Streptomyces europaeiscabiei]MDX3629193.1 hypothetical protein [Streptomyces europaeiscabiei]MDX3647189.1 hypothetical protein [Streptomyces europaeiscabiei]
MTTESVAPPARRADLDTTLRRPRTGHLSAAELAMYFDTLAEAVRRVDPGPSAPCGWESRERLWFSTWVRAAYEHPLSAAVFGHPDAGVARSAQHRQAAELGLRMEVSGTGVRPARPTPHVRAAAAVAAVWSVTALAVTQSPRPPRERVVSDAWLIAQEIIAPALPTAGPGLTRARARGAW